MLTCKEVTALVGSDGLVRAGWRTRLGVKFHLLMCKHCSRYARQLRAIAGEARRIYGELPKVAAVEEAILKTLRRK